MKTSFEEMMSGLDDVESYLAGNRKGFRAYVPDTVDVKRIRARLKMTQSRFSQTFGFSLDAIKHWEGGRRKPEASARTLLMVIAHSPETVLVALHPKNTKAFVPKPVRNASKARKAQGHVAVA